MNFITVEMNRLTMPKRSTVSAAGDVEALMKRPNPGVPPNGLPIWEKLPLDAKLPVVASPKNAIILYTTNLCEKIHKSSRDHDFILHDPDARFLSNNYQTLHDPHLRSHLCQKRMKKRLYRGGFITKNGKVLCTLKEFNQYRQYLRRIHLEALSYDRQKKDEELRARNGGQKPNQVAAGGASIHKSRELKVREIRKRLKEQYEGDKERYKKIMLDHEARRERITNEKINKMTEHEHKRIAERARREAVIKKQEMEESRRKMHIHRKWMIEDEMRRARADERRLNREITLQNQLEEAWEQRKEIQQQRILDEETARQSEDEKRKKNIHDRETSIMKQRKKRDAVFHKMQEQTKKERDKKEAIYRQRLDKEIERRRAERAAKMRKKSRRTSTGPQSEWKLKEALTKEHAPLMGTGKPLRKYSKEELGVADLRGARFSKECIIEKEKKRPNRCNFACLLLPFETKADDNDIPLGAPVVNKRLEYLQRDIQPKQSVSNINLQLIATEEAEDEEPSEGESPPVSEPVPLMIKNKSGSCIENFQENFNAVTRKLSGSLESLASFVVDWTINIAQMIVHPGTSLSTSLCSQCENDLMLAYSPSGQSPYSRPESPTHSPSEEDRMQKALQRGVRFSGVEETIPSLPRTCSDDEGVGTGGSFVGLKLKDSLTRMRESQISMESLVENLKILLEDLEAGKLSPSDMERLEAVTRDILQSAVTVADSVNAVAPEDELRADAGKKRSAILIEALVSQTLNDALEDVKRSNEDTTTSSELLGDMIGYALNEAVDQAKNLDAIHLAREDSMLIGQHLEDTMQRALWDVDHRRMSTEAIFLGNIIQNVMVSVTTDIRTGRLPKAALENLAMAIVRSNDMIRQSKSETTMTTPAPAAHGQKAHDYIRTALLKIMEAIDKKELSGNEVAAMADRMCSSIYDATDDGGFKRLTSPASVSVMSSFVKEVINNCLNLLTEDTAAKIVSRMLNEASLSPTASEDDAAAMVAAREDIDRTDEINTFVQNVLNKSLDDSDEEAEKPDSYLSGAATITVIETFITGVLSGSIGEVVSSGKPKKPAARRTSLTDLVVNGFLRNVINHAMDQCQPGVEPEQSDASVVDNDSPSQIISVYVRDVVSKGKTLASQHSSETIVSSLAKEVSSTLVDHVDKNKSNEIQDHIAPRDGSSVDLMAHTHESHSGVFSDESSDEEEKLRNAEPLEVEITPVLRNKRIDIDPQETSPALSAISMRSSMAGHLAHRFEATARNSFASLIHPDLSRVRGLKHDSAADVKRKLHEAYVQSVMRISRDTVVCADEVHEPGTVSDSSSDDDDDIDEEIKAIDCCPSNVVAKPEDEPTSTKTTSSLKAISPVMSKSSKTSTVDGAKSNSQTRVPRQASSTSRNVKQSHSGSGNIKESSNKVVASTSNSVRKASSSGSRTGGTDGAKKESPLAKQSSGNSRSNLQKPSSQTSATSAKNLLGKPSSSQNPLTPKSSKKSTTSTNKSGWSVPKIKPARSKASDTGKPADKTTSKEIKKVTSTGSSSSKKSSTASPQTSGTKMTSQLTKKTPSGGSTVSKGNGRTGPAETGSINDLRLEKEIKKSLSEQTTSQTGLQSTTKLTSPTQQTSDSKLLSGGVSKGQAAGASTSVPGRMNPSDSAIGAKSPAEDHQAAADAPRILSDGEVVKVRSLYGSFSSTIQVRSNTDVHKTDSSGTKVDMRSSNHRVTPKSSGSVR